MPAHPSPLACLRSLLARGVASGAAPDAAAATIPPEPAASTALLHRVERHQAAVVRGIVAAIALGGGMFAAIRVLSVVSTRPARGPVLLIPEPDGASVVATMGLMLAIAIGLQLGVRAQRDPERVDEHDHRAERVFLGRLGTLTATATAFGAWYMITAPSIVGRAPVELDFVGLFGVGIGALLIIAISVDAAVASNAGLDPRLMAQAWRDRRRGQLQTTLRLLGEQRCDAGQDDTCDAVPRLWPRIAVTLAVMLAGALAGVVVAAHGSPLAHSIAIGIVVALGSAYVIHASVGLLASVGNASPLSMIVDAAMPGLASLAIGTSSLSLTLGTLDESAQPQDVAIILAGSIVVTALPGLAAGALYLLPFPRDRARRPLFAMARRRVRAQREALDRASAGSADRSGPWDGMAWVAIACSPLFPLGPVAAALSTRMWRSEHRDTRLPPLLRRALVIAWSTPPILALTVLALPWVVGWLGWYDS